MALVPISPPPREPITKDDVSSNWEMWFSLLAKRVSQLVAANATVGSVTSAALSTPGDGLFTTGSPITVAGTFTVTLDDDVAAIEALTGTGLARRTAVNTWSLDSTVYAPLASPAFTGIPTAPLAALGTDTTQLATTSFVQQELLERTAMLLCFAAAHG